MRSMLIVVLGCCLALNASAAEKKTKKGGTAKTAKTTPAPAPDPAPVAPAPEAAAPVPAPDAAPAVRKHVAVVEVPAAGGLAQESVSQAARMVEAELKTQGFDVIGAAQVEAAHAKRGLKVPTCGDVAGCLANIGQIVGASYVANVSVGPAGKQFGFKLTIIDALDAKTVANKMSLLAKLDEAVLAQDVTKQVGRIAVILRKYIADKPPAPEPTPPPEPVQVVAKIEPPVTPVPPPVTPPVAPPVQPEPKVSKGAGPVPWVLMGLGVVAVGVGVGAFGTQASSAAADFKAGRDPSTARSSAKSKALLADVTSGVGAALILTGGALLLFTGGDESPAKSVYLTPAGPGLAVAGSF